MFREGDKIGSYILKKRIGTGAFGVVWLAEETTLLASHKVALKLPSEAEVNIETIRQEAVLWEQVKGHPNILPIIKADIVDDQIYIASEYAPDGSLVDWIEKHRGRAPSSVAAIDMTKGILAGLGHLHSKSVIHRDLKPENILLQGEIPRIADFGIARMLKETHSSQIAGTPNYMAPEGFDGVRSEQTDIWAVGVIFYQLITGLLPYPQTDLMSAVKAIVYEEPEIDERKIPPQLLPIIRKAIEKDPVQRYQTVSLMLGDLKNVDSMSFEDTSTAPTIPDIRFSTGEAKTEVLDTARNAKTVDTRKEPEPRLTDAEKTDETQHLTDPPGFMSISKNSRYLKVGGGILAALIVVAGIIFTGFSLIEPSPDTKDAESVIPETNSNTSALDDDLHNRSLWAEWALMLETEEFEKIVSEASDEIKRNPKSVVAYRMRAIAQYNLERPEQGRFDVREVLRLSTNPSTAEEYESYCYALRAINKPDEALKNCNKAIELDPQLALAYNLRGTIYHQKRKYDLAVTDYSKAVELSPRKTFFQNRALSYRALGNRKLAVNDETEAKNIERFRRPNAQVTSPPKNSSGKSARDKKPARTSKESTAKRRPPKSVPTPTSQRKPRVRATLAPKPNSLKRPLPLRTRPRPTPSIKVKPTEKNR